MSFSGVEEPRLGAETLQFDQQGFQRFVEEELEPFLVGFRRSSRKAVFFHHIFFALFAVESVLFTTFFSILSRSHLVALSFALLFLTVFSYFILRLYWKTRRPEELLNLRSSFLERCRNWMNYQEGVPEHHLGLAQAVSRMASRLQDQEYHFYRLPKGLAPLQLGMQKFSCYWHWEDVHQTRELLLQASIEEHLRLIKCEPTNLEIHASLANAYVLLSALYAKPKVSDDDDRWTPSGRFSEAMRDRFRTVSGRAIEEFQILRDYAPDDPWIHAQLAYSYHDLQMPEEEIREYETILRIRPDDKETLFKLGVLYFQQGKNGDGLRIYEELRHTQHSKADALIKFYGA